MYFSNQISILFMSIIFFCMTEADSFIPSAPPSYKTVTGLFTTWLPRQVPPLTQNRKAHRYNAPRPVIQPR